MGCYTQCDTKDEDHVPSPYDSMEEDEEAAGNEDKEPREVSILPAETDESLALVEGPKAIFQARTTKKSKKKKDKTPGREIQTTFEEVVEKGPEVPSSSKAPLDGHMVTPSARELYWEVLTTPIPTVSNCNAEYWRTELQSWKVSIYDFSMRLHTSSRRGNACRLLRISYNRIT